MRVALYARVSTADKHQTPETQLVALREYAERNGHEITEEYVDWGWSGKKEKRPSLDRMMLDAGKGKFGMVLVARFDRFARSTRHMLKALDELNRAEVQFASLAEHVDTSTPLGRFFFTIIAAFAEMERECIRERVNLGLARARKQGIKLGRPTAQVDEQLLRQQFRDGASKSLLAKQAGISRDRVRKILREESL